MTPDPSRYVASFVICAGHIEVSAPGEHVAHMTLVERLERRLHRKLDLDTVRCGSVVARRSQLLARIGSQPAEGIDTKRMTEVVRDAFGPDTVVYLG